MTLLRKMLPTCDAAEMALRTVAVVLQDPVAVFEFGVLTEVFGIDRSDDGVPAFDFRVCTENPGMPLRGDGGVTLTAPLGLGATTDADLVAIPASDAAYTPSEAVKQVVRDAVDRGAYVLSVCSGAFTLGAAGVLDGREVTTHWRHSDELAAAYPLAKVNPDVLYAHDGTVITSAGTAAGLDACLHLVRAEHGGAVANRIARRMVVSPHRDGGQRQFIDRPVPVTESESLSPILEWMLEHLAQPHTVSDLARRASMSSRTFARRFVAETGTTPHQWVTDQRVLRARELLEETDLSIEQIAGDVGFGSAALLRHHFAQCTGLTPTVFRTRHRSPA
ncbi:putative transcriptional regulator [Janibacter sp. HTCC2649]|nr:putative transcriptional regulator [Janibacter sp. HTCC2649]